MTKRATPRKRLPRKNEVSEKTVKGIIERIALGETLAQCCRDSGMPSEATVRRRIHQSSSLRSAYARACESRTLRWAEELIEIAEDGTNDWMEKQGKKGTYVALNEEHVRRSTLRIDTRKWLLSKLMPGQYGDKVEHTGAGGGPIQHEHALSPAMLANLDALRARLPALPSVQDKPGVIDVGEV